MDESISDIDRRMLKMEGLINAQHALLVVFIADIHLAALEDPEKRLAEFREELFHVTRDMISEKTAASTRIIVAAMAPDEVDLIAHAAGRVLEAAGTDSPRPDNARTGASRPSEGPDHPQELDGAPAALSTAQRTEAA